MHTTTVDTRSLTASRNYGVPHADSSSSNTIQRAKQRILPKDALNIVHSSVESSLKETLLSSSILSTSNGVVSRIKRDIRNAPDSSNAAVTSATREIQSRIVEQPDLPVFSRIYSQAMADHQRDHAVSEKVITSPIVFLKDADMPSPRQLREAQTREIIDFLIAKNALFPEAKASSIPAHKLVNKLLERLTAFPEERLEIARHLLRPSGEYGGTEGEELRPFRQQQIVNDWLSDQMLGMSLNSWFLQAMSDTKAA